jgi:hypothetical protein
MALYKALDCAAMLPPLLAAAAAAADERGLRAAGSRLAPATVEALRERAVGGGDGVEEEDAGPAPWWQLAAEEEAAAAAAEAARVLSELPWPRLPAAGHAATDGALYAAVAAVAAAAAAVGAGAPSEEEWDDACIARARHIQTLWAAWQARGREAAGLRRRDSGDEGEEGEAASAASVAAVAAGRGQGEDSAAKGRARRPSDHPMVAVERALKEALRRRRKRRQQRRQREEGEA